MHIHIIKIKFKAQLIKDNGSGVKVDEVTKVPGLLYADDLAIFADSDDNLNKTFDVVNEWCKDCDLKVNAEKCNVFHFRKKIKDITNQMCFQNWRTNNPDNTIIQISWGGIE